MKNPTIEQAMAFPWQPKITQEPEGGYKCVVVPNLSDFVIYGATMEELEADWRDALRTHLRAYIDTGKCIPIGHERLIVVQTANTAGRGKAQVLDLGELLTRSS